MLNYQSIISDLESRIKKLELSIDEARKRQEYFIEDAAFFKHLMETHPNVQQESTRIVVSQGNKNMITRNDPKYAQYNYMRAIEHAQKQDEKILDKELKIQVYQRRILSYRSMNTN